jgi:hypothetical protein
VNSKKLNRLLAGLLAVLIISIFGITYAINGLLEHQSGRLVTFKTRLTALTQEQTQLTQLKKNITTYNDLYHISRIVVPQSKDQTEAVRQIVDLAAANHVYLASISFPPSNLGTTASPVGSAGGAATTPTSATPTVNSATTALSQLKPVPNIPGVYDLDIGIVSASDTNHLATYPQMIGFLSGLEQNRLTAQVSSISIVPSSQDPSHLSFNLNLDIYIKPGKPQP